MDRLFELGWRLPALAALADGLLAPVRAVATFDDPSGPSPVDALRERLLMTQRDRDALAADLTHAAELFEPAESAIQTARVTAGLPAPAGGESTYCRAILMAAAAAAEGVRGCLLRLGVAGVANAEPVAIVNAADDLARLAGRLPVLEPVVPRAATELATARASARDATVDFFKAQLVEVAARQTQAVLRRAAAVRDDTAAEGRDDGWSADGLSLRWGGALFTMTPSAAAVVRLLVDAFRRGVPLSEQYLKTEAESESDVRTLVRDNNLGSLVIPFAQDGKRRRGFWTLVDPKKKSDPR